MDTVAHIDTEEICSRGSTCYPTLLFSDLPRLLYTPHESCSLLNELGPFRKRGDLTTLDGDPP